MIKKFLLAGCMMFFATVANAQNMEYTPNYDQVMNPSKPANIDEAVFKEDRLRGKALRDNAMEFGSQSGLRWASEQINSYLDSKSRELDNSYNFNSFIVTGPYNSKIVPPVIIESDDTMEFFDRRKTLRIADKKYIMLSNCEFSHSTPPMWQTYLKRYPARPTIPTVFPKNPEELAIWREAAAEGWAKGLELSKEIFDADLRRLQRDFTGMVLYHTLTIEKKVEPCFAGSNDLGVTGDKNTMNVNDRVAAITKEAEMRVNNPKEWKPNPSPLNPSESAGNDAPVVEQTQTYQSSVTERNQLSDTNAKPAKPKKAEQKKPPKPKKQEVKPKKPVENAGQKVETPVEVNPALISSKKQR